MKLIEKLKVMFLGRELDVSEKPPSLFDRLRNVFFSAEFLAADLDRVPPDCSCEDAIAHLDGRCCCTISPKEASKTGSTKGCAQQLERLQVDIKWVHEALKRGKASLDPGEESEELSGEFTHIANAVEGLGLILERVKAHVGEFQETCTNMALQRVKETSTELRGYTREFLRTLNKNDFIQTSSETSEVQQRKAGQVKVRHTNLLVLAGLLLFTLTQSVRAQEFTYKVQQDRLIGHRDGELIISNTGVEYRAKKEKESRSWTYTDIKLFEILTPTRVRIWTYQNRKLFLDQEESLTFKIVEGQIDQNVSNFLRERISRPLVTSLTEEEGQLLTEIPVKHLHRLSGCQGILKVYADRLVYEAQDNHDSRSWRWTDIRAVGRPDIDRFEVLTFEPQTAGPRRSFNFILKQPLPDKTFDFIWSRVFRPTPLIRAEAKVSGR
ncbi:MAG TPA: hypothetical protein VI750_11515 [Pyrinomonadaceae bacterium]|nr:hypothetical protein [Pyrinomonadaceae bacterium]